MKNLIINIPFRGFYESLFRAGIDYAEESTIYNEVEGKGRNPSKCADAFFEAANYRKAHLYGAQEYVYYFNKYVAEEFGLDLGLEFETVQSPREMTNLPAKAKQWGHGAFARYCAKRQIPFETCYRAIFGRLPRI